MENITIYDYVIVNNGLFNKDAVIVFFIIFYLFGCLINIVSNYVSCIYVLLVLIPLSLLFALNGPDKASYLSLYNAIDTVSDVFKYYNTIDSPLYYITMVLFKNIGLTFYSFMVVQNLIISFSLSYLIYKYKWGYHIAMWLYFTHLLVPFSVRGHLVIITILFANRSVVSKIISSLGLVAIHPLISALPITYQLRGLIRGKRSILIIVLTICALVFSSSYLISKYTSYAINGDEYVKNAGLSLIHIVDAIELLLFWSIIRPIALIDKLFLLFPVVLSFGTIIIPMLGRFSYACDLVYILILINNANRLKNKKTLFMCLSLIALIRFVKNYYSIEYFIL